jgi:hypothetical protein
MFEVGVQPLVGVQLRRIAREIEDFDAIIVSVQPGLDRLGMMDAQIVQDQEE